MQNIALLLIGFSVFYVVVLVLTHFDKGNFQQQKTSHAMGVLLFLSLAGIQLIHFDFLQNHSSLIYSQRYLTLLFLVAPCFYFYSRPLLKAQSSFSLFQLIHFTPVISVFFVPHKIAFTLAFIIGSGYMLWLLSTIYALRSYRDQFKSEIVLLLMVFIIALTVSVMALTQPFSEKLFYSLYASAVGLALLIVALVLSYKPQMSKQVSEVAKQAYAVSTLSSIDCEEKIEALNQLMIEGKLYQQNNLDLLTIATEIDLSSHQLSELINSKLAMSFSRYLREQRISASKKLLIEQPTASTLSVGLEVGFSSQSNFYGAFKEITKTTPGNFRKQNLD